jgi:urease accessory protein
VADCTGSVLHSHDGLAPHYHEPIPSPGEFAARAPPLRRDYAHRSFTVGIGGPVGTGCAGVACA